MRYCLEGERTRFGKTELIGSKVHEKSAIRMAKRLIKRGLFVDVRIFDQYDCVWDSEDEVED